MLFTVTVDLPNSAHFEFSTESFFEMAKIAQMLGNTDVDDEDEDDEEVYVYDEDADCYCWYDEEHEAWYWLDVVSGDWLLVEDADGYEVESE